VTIANNTANWDVQGGGGMYLWIDSHPILTYVTIANNTTNANGGGMFVWESSPTLTNVTITNNAANQEGGGIYLDGSNLTLTNSIIWDNIQESISLSNENGESIIIYSDIEGGWEGEGNIDLDPLFFNPDSGDYSLMETSPCIDAGIIIGDMEYFCTTPDMGAYEFGESCQIMAGDTNFDGNVDILDIVRIVNQMMGNLEFNENELIAADYNADGILDVSDIVQIIDYILPD